jgi:CBS domain-containing protein
MWWPAIGGLVVGLGGYFDPRVLGVGYDTIHHLMTGELLGASLVTLVVAKGIVWSVALGSGTSGGVLAPLLMIGGALGALLGTSLGVPDPGLWAMVGMAAMMGGTMRSPLTGMIFVLELTHDLNTLPALLVGTVAGLAVTVLLLRRSILTEKLARRGQHITREYSVDIFSLARVADVMDRTPPTIQANVTVAALAARIAGGDPLLSRRQGVVVLDDSGHLAGIITRGDIMDSIQANTAGKATVLEAARKDVIVAYPDETLHDAVARMLQRDIGRLPVVDPADPKRVVGYLGRADILAARVKLDEEENLRQKGPLLGTKDP